MKKMPTQNGLKPDFEESTEGWGSQMANFLLLTDYHAEVWPGVSCISGALKEDGDGNFPSCGGRNF